ncbi:MAG: hypothetical protein M3028_04985, partial [Bifidobacterium sp.]|nr:hypothetical protein [Bifidobacterium sp.]
MATSSEHVDEQSDKDQQDSNLVVDESGLKVDHRQEEELEHLRSDRSFFGYPKGIGILATGNLFNSICW